MTQITKFLLSLKHAKYTTFIKQHLIYYLTATVTIIVLKLFSEGADADTLRFLLAPVSYLVSFICRAPFLWEPHAGYVSHDLRFLIAASCSGINFLMITVGMLLFSFYSRFSENKLLRMIWLPLSLILSYCHTILTNVVRILLAIYLPVSFEKQGVVPALLSHDTLHTLIGIVVYFSSLLFLYTITDRFIHKVTATYASLPAPSEQKTWLCTSSALFPFLWYAGFIWGLPFVSRLLNGNFNGFGKYSLLVFGSCIVICLISQHRYRWFYH